MGNKLDFSPEELTAKEKKKFLIGSVIPRPIALVSTKSDSGVVNVAPFSYFTIVTYNPPIFSIAVQRTDGKPKDTSRNIFENKEAVIHIVDTDNVEEANITSTLLGPDDSELNISNFTSVQSKKVAVPGLKETKVRFETELYDSMIIYNEENNATADLILLKVKHYHIDEDIYHDGYIDPLKLKAVSRLAGNDYAEIGEIFTVERPK
ncbi:MAG: flavin reductase family protein [Carnobacterium sp.]|uniref:flavin reductase family protein n=1 Tax=Carnobacterium sp. TaxID=48221 RepID=UPI003C784C04